MNRPTIVEIDLKSLDFNLKKLKNKINFSKFFPVVKADAYGHGVKEISQFLKNKVDGFCVATSEEALNLRMFSKKPILDLEGPYDLEDMKSLIENDIQFVIHSERQLSFFQKIKKLDTRYPIWLKFDSGMNRLGFPIHDASKIFQKVAKKTNRIVLMSHFFSFRGNSKQLKKFKELQESCFSNKVSIKNSLSNSGGRINYPTSQKDIVRPGICLYGSSSNLVNKNIKLKPVMTLKSKFISIKEIEKGEKVGYEGTWEAKKKSTIGILPIGYGDGYPINLSNCGKVCINENLAPVIGNVSMDMVAIDLSKISKISYKDEAILWGKGHDIDTVAKYADNSSYSLMTGLTKRVKRIYLNHEN